MFEYIISFIAPHICLSCNNEGTLLCYECRSALPLVPAFYQQRSLPMGAAHPITGLNVFAATKYRGPAKDLIHMLKFDRARAGADAAARLMAERMPPLADDIVVSFVPTASRRIRVRGYDQAALIARRLAVLREVAYLPLLERRGQQRQVGQSGSVRRQQLQGAFQVRAGQHASAKHVLLVDDVLTTGATLEAAADALYRAAARRVDAVVFAAV